jgi:dTDP-4-dehydrorhamnose 3,5-epimerase
LRKLETSLPGVWELHSDLLQDDRGFFMETYHQAKFAALGISHSFPQENHSCSRKGTLRGLHYQLRRPQAKLCRVIEGQAFDVAVDIRVGSPHFGKWTSVLLSAGTGIQVYIPAGFAHGFLALTETVQLLYKCSNLYDPLDERGIAWNDPGLAITWGISDPLLSAKDAGNPTLAATPLDFLPRFPGQ